MEYHLIGNHIEIQKIRELIQVVSDTALSVLILGETGTGKGVVSQLLHQASPRGDRPFIKVNCAAFPFTLLESELFGYEKGAFTGADKLKPGKFEIASNGVLFLDEIGDMPLLLQAKLLQVLQSGEFTRLGGTQDVKVNTWVISSTNCNMAQSIAGGRFREDLYYRLNIIKVEMPPLRNRREDIPLLIDYFVGKYRAEFSINGDFTIPLHMNDLFQGYHWPGNVRELASIILRLMVGDDPLQIRAELIDNMRLSGVTGSAPSLWGEGDGINDSKESESDSQYITSLKDVKAMASDYIEKRTILHALHTAGWNKTEAAKKLKISYKALFYKMDHLGINKRGSSEKRG